MQLQIFTTEILDAIFQKLSIADQLACSSVCRFWRTVVAPLCYRNIIFSDLHYHQIASIISEEKDWLLGIYVQSLNISMNCDPPTKEIFSLMLSQLPFLKRVTISSQYYHIYMDYLQKMNKAIRLEEINANSSPQMDYLKCVHHHRQSIKYFTLYLYNAAGYGTPRVFFDNPLQYLKDLVKLRYLTISIGRPHLRDTLTLLNVLQYCPNLVRLNFCNHLPDSAINEDLLFTPQHHHLLEQVTLELYHLTLSHIKYILSYFPKYLNLFSITLTRTDSSAWLITNKNGETAMQCFGNYLGQSVRKVEITIENSSLTGAYGENPIGSYDTVAAYMPFVKSIQGDRKLLYHLFITMASLGALHDRGTIGLTRDEHSLIINYTLDVEDFVRHIGEDPYSFLSSSNSKKSLKSVHILIQDDSITPNGGFAKIIRSLLRSYSSLDFMMLTINPSYARWTSAIKFGTKKNDCNSSCNMINRNMTIAKPLCRDLKYISFENVKLSTSSLKEITDLFSDIKVLKLIPCRIIDYTYREVTLDFSEITHLEALVLNLDEHLHDGVNLYGFNLQLENVITRNTTFYYAEIHNSQRFTYKKVKALITEDPKQLYLGSTTIPIITIRYQKIDVLSIGVIEGQPIFNIFLQ